VDGRDGGATDSGKLHSSVRIDATRIPTGTVHRPRSWSVTPQDKPADWDFPVFMAISPRTENGDSERGTKPPNPDTEQNRTAPTGTEQHRPDTEQHRPDTEQHRPDTDQGEPRKKTSDSSPSDPGPERTDGIHASSDRLTPGQPHERFGTGAFLSD